MPAHDDLKARRGRIEVEFFHVVEHIQDGVSSPHDRRCRQPRILVDIALHREDGSDLPQLFQNLHPAHIARVHDQR